LIGEREVVTTDKFSDAKEVLTEKVAAKYPKLTEDEIKTLAVDDKWLATLAAAVQGELDRVSHTLTGRIRELAERYVTPLPQLTDELAALAGHVDGHLRCFGPTRMTLRERIASDRPPTGSVLPASRENRYHLPQSSGFIWGIPVDSF
jgi:hypothetical protein